MVLAVRRGFFTLLVLTGSLLWLGVVGCEGNREAAPEAAEARPNGYLFCFWNAENLFDDHEDNRANKADKEFDQWFANNPEILRLKLNNLSKALIEMNGGQGPDILALAEVENERAADLLRQALNARLSDRSLHYPHLLMKELSGGRHIAPAIITRLPVRRDRTRLHGRLLRILEGHVVVNDHDLVILATHWTSRVSDKDGEHRARYADQVYGVFKAMYRSNPAVDLLVCGDFNDPPDAPSVIRHLHATGNREAVLKSSPEEPLLLDLFANKDPAEFGTHYHAGHWYIFDQIVASPGLLDSAGWRCDPDSVRTVNSLFRPGDRLRRPWPFGNEREKAQRGYSDHFPVTVRLEVAR